jgi:hypothetical protein
MPRPAKFPAALLRRVFGSSNIFDHFFDLRATPGLSAFLFPTECGRLPCILVRAVTHPMIGIATYEAEVRRASKFRRERLEHLITQLQVHL